MKASDLFVKALENEGVKYVFALPAKKILTCCSRKEFFH
jgi:thiamine pyrophosphate-dependent acetolactate synthase large subunit-like protein